MHGKGKPLFLWGKMAAGQSTLSKALAEREAERDFAIRQS